MARGPIFRADRPNPLLPSAAKARRLHLGNPAQFQLSTYIPKWVNDLFSPSHQRSKALTAATLIGLKNPNALFVGQIEMHNPHLSRPFNVWLTLKEQDLLRLFMATLYLSSKAAALRSAIFIGLELRGNFRGKITPTRKRPFSGREVRSLCTKAGCIAPYHEDGLFIHRGMHGMGADPISPNNSQEVTLVGGSSL